MPYRESAATPSQTQRVELLRFEPKPWFRQRSVYALLFVMFFASRARYLRWDSFNFIVALGLVWIVGVAAFVLRNAWLDCARLVVALERDAAGRRVVIERSLGPIVRRRTYDTEETVTLSTDKGEVFSSLLTKRSPALTVRLHTGAHKPIELFSNFDEAEAERFSSTMEGFDARAAQVATAEELRRIEAERVRNADEKQRAINDRYRAWFDEVVTQDHSAGLEEVLERGFSIDRPVDRNGSTALDLAALAGATQCVRLLIERGALATSHSLSLAANGAPTNESDARHRRYVETVRVLVDAGADPHGRDRDGGETAEALKEAGPAFVAASATPKK
ncbi:MAG: hypothetical protein JNK05_09550 [Myxococcales bacterium]|nr:hypothetical protein [Myxococcales bacterium]